MELKECYLRINGDLNDVLGRLRHEQTVQKFIFKFLDDSSYRLLKESMECKNYEEAFRAAHTLKGVCQNLSFTKLYKSSSQITEFLRSADYQKAAEFMPQLSKDYVQTTESIKDYKSFLEESAE